MSIEETIGHQVRRARELQGMTQTELGSRLANRLGRPLSRQAVCFAEAGNRDFRAAEIEAFSEVLGVPVNWLFGQEARSDALKLREVLHLQAEAQKAIAELGDRLNCYSDS